MPLTRCCFAGVDETTPLVELAVVSDLYPYAEWAFLYSPKLQGTPGRFPSLTRIRRAFAELPPYVLTALHLGDGAVRDLLAGEPVVRGLLEQAHTRRARVQLDIPAAQAADLEPLAPLMREHPRAMFVTRQSPGTAAVTPALATVPNHAIVFEADPDGRTPPHWPQGLEGIACGYCGGLGPQNLLVQLPLIYDAAGGAEFWIQIDERVRDNDDRFSMSSARRCLAIVSTQAELQADIPAPRPMRRRCEPLALIDNGLLGSDVEGDCELLLRELVDATRDALDPAVLSVRRRAQNLLLRRRASFAQMPVEAGSGPQRGPARN